MNDNSNFEKLPQFPHTVNASFITPVDITVLELTKALRECFVGTNGKIPTAPLDQLIAHYDMFYNLDAHDEQLETNRNDVTQAVRDIMKAKSSPDPRDDEPHEQTGFGD